MKNLNKDYNRGLLVTVVIISAFIAMLNQTILSVAQPTIISDLKISLSNVQWLSTGYSLIGGILIPISAWFADRFNTKKLVIVSLTIFLIGTVVAYLANDFTFLLIGRLIQATGAGIISGLTMAILFSVYPKENRGTPTTLLGMVFGIAPAIGPTLGGYIVDSLSWKAIFGLIIPLLVIDIILAAMYMFDVIPHKNTKLDILSVITSTLGFGGILYSASLVADNGWSSFKVLSTLILGIIILGIFIWRQLTISNPMLNLKIFANRNFTVAAIIGAVAQISMVSVEFILPLYLQNVRGLTALESGLTLLPGAIVMFILAPLSGKLVQKNLGRLTIIVGISVMTLSTLILLTINLNTPIWAVISIYALRNVGLTFAMMPAGTVGMHSLTPDLISHGSAGNNVVRQVGAAIGTAALVSVMQNVSSSTAPSEALVKVHPEAFIHGMKVALLNGAHAALLISTIIGAVGIFFAFLLKANKRAKN